MNIISILCRRCLWRSLIIFVTVALCFMLNYSFGERFSRLWDTDNTLNKPRTKLVRHNCAEQTTLNEYCSTALLCKTQIKRACNDLTILEEIQSEKTRLKSTSQVDLLYLRSKIFLQFNALHLAANNSLSIHALDDSSYFIRTPTLDTVAYPKNNLSYAYIFRSPVVHRTQRINLPYRVLDNSTYATGKIQPYSAGFLILRNAIAQSSNGNMLVQTCNRAITVIGCSNPDTRKRLQSRFPEMSDEGMKCVDNRTSLEVTILSFRKLVVIAHTWYEAFYHFSVEAMSRLMLVYDLVLLDPDVFILMKYPMYRSTAEELLRLLGIKGSQIFYYHEQKDKPTLFRAELMIVPRGVACGGAPPSLLQQLNYRVTSAIHRKQVPLKPYFSPNFPITEFDSRNVSKLFESHHRRAVGPIVIISRQKSRERRIVNEIDIVLYVSQKYPTVNVVLFKGDEPLLDTIILFQSARAVIAPHGAGLSHILWMRSGTAILEVFPINSYNGCYQAIAQYQGIQSYAYFTIPIDTVMSMKVDMDIFGQLLEEMMRGRA